MAVPALWAGLLYDRASLEGALALLRPHGPALAAARREIARVGLRARLDGSSVTVLDLARELVRLAAAGLEARGRGERRFLAPAEEIVATGRMSRTPPFRKEREKRERERENSGPQV
jgi:glutamate--cysteine ligase